MDEVFDGGIRPFKSKEPLLHWLAFVLYVLPESQVGQFQANKLDLLETALVLHVVLDIFSDRVWVLWLENLIIVLRVISGIFVNLILVLIRASFLVVLLGLKGSLLLSFF